MQKSEVLDNLCRHLQTAVMLELSTLPPYLCAQWSIHGSSVHAVHARSFILSVVQEEMLHMAMACNMLNALGCAPVLNDVKMLPRYPCVLPGHSATANPFTVHLNKCCPAAISTFLKIEMPSTLVHARPHADGWCTIGEFYDEVEKLLNSDLLSDSDFSHGRQIAASYNPAHGKLYEVHSRADALDALAEIIDQGEGHDANLYDKDHQLTHYWKFVSIRDLMENEIWNYHEEVHNMHASPDERLFSAEARELSNKFNTLWTQLLDSMQAAVSSDSPSFDEAINIMMKLKKPAQALMQLPLTDGSGNAGPLFQYNS
jgi:hypothetical protein